MRSLSNTPGETFPSKTLTLFTAALTAATLTFSSPATAQIPVDDPPGGGSGKGKREASFSVGVFSNLVWRGQELNTGASVQPMSDLVWNGFGFNFWSNYDVDLKYVKETDYTLNYAGAHNKLGYDFGVIYYGLRKPTTELYISLDYDVILAPYATFYLDVDAGQGGFLIVGIRQPVTVTDAIAINLGAYASVNFDNATMGLDENGETFTDFYNTNLETRTIIALSSDWAFGVLVAYSFALTDAAKSGISGASATGEKNVFYYAAGVGVGF